jgi:hypothetical protein
MYSFHNFFKKTSRPPSASLHRETVESITGKMVKPKPTIPKPLDDLQTTLINDGVKILLLEKKVADLEEKIALLEGK